MMPSMVDLFSGTGSASEPMLKRGWDVERVDILDGKDVRDWTPRHGVDLIWASPPCTTFSVASIGTHWAGGRGAYIPKTLECTLQLGLVRQTLGKIEESAPRFWILENPRGVLRKIIGLPTDTTWWCQWGDERAKPTDLWGRIPLSMLPLPKCKNGNTDHAAAPRGAKTGTQGRHSPLDRARIPQAFAERLALAVEEEMF